jgi:hypothetical protein
MDTKVIINKESKKQLFNNLSTELKDNKHKKYFKLIFDILCPDIDIHSLPIDVINIIKEYSDDQISFYYYLHIYKSNIIPNINIGIHNDEYALLKDRAINIMLTIKKRGKYIAVGGTHTIDKCIIKTYKKNDNDALNMREPNLCAIANHYMKEKYNISNYIPQLINNNPIITSKKNNLYESIDVTDSTFSIRRIQIVDKYLFEIIISIISELTTCLCEHLNI